MKRCDGGEEIGDKREKKRRGEKKDGQGWVAGVFEGQTQGELCQTPAPPHPTPRTPRQINRQSSGSASPPACQQQGWPAVEQTGLSPDWGGDGLGRCLLLLERTDGLDAEACVLAEVGSLVLIFTSSSTRTMMASVVGPRLGVGGTPEEEGGRAACEDGQTYKSTGTDG
jgi:hypothetical protein